MPIKINLIAPPGYVVTAQTMDRDKGLERLNEALKKIEDSIKAAGGIFTIQQAPKVVTDIDDAELARKLERLDQENQEVAGDDDEDEYDNEDGQDADDADEDGVNDLKKQNQVNDS